jgi:hypothetical protein
VNGGLHPSGGHDCEVSWWQAAGLAFMALILL